MIKTFKSIFDSEVDFLEGEAAVLLEKISDAKAEHDKLKQAFEAKSERLRSLPEKKKDYENALVHKRIFLCPFCFVRSGESHELAPIDSGDKYDSWKCRVCNEYMDTPPV